MLIIINQHILSEEHKLLSHSVAEVYEELIMWTFEFLFLQLKSPGTVDNNISSKKKVFK